MVTSRDIRDEAEDRTPGPLVLSEGAGIALGTVFKRIVTSKPSHKRKAIEKRPRPGKTPVVFADSEEVQKNLALKKKENKRLKEARKVKLQFESNGRIIPDAATGAALEKELIATATKGAVALFNAVSKAQKVSDNDGTKGDKKKAPISKEAFMDMMVAGVNKTTLVPGSDAPPSHLERSSKDEGRIKSSAKWLEDDFMTTASRKLKDWDKKGNSASSESSSEDNDEKMLNREDERADGSDSGSESSEE